MPKYIFEEGGTTQEEQDNFFSTYADSILQQPQDEQEEQEESVDSAPQNSNSEELYEEQFESYKSKLDEYFEERMLEIDSQLQLLDFYDSEEGSKFLTDQFDTRNTTVPFGATPDIDPGKKKGPYDPYSAKVPTSGINRNIAPLYTKYKEKYKIGNLGVWGNDDHLENRKKSDHNTGNAIDLFTEKVRPDIVKELLAEAKERNIRYLVHDRKTWFPDGRVERNNDTNPHTTHIHVSFNK